MKNTIKFFATLLTFISLTTIIQAQPPRGGTGGKVTSARIPVLQKEAAKQKTLKGIEMNGRFKKYQKQAAMQEKAANQKSLKKGNAFLANKRKAALQKPAAKQKAIKAIVEMNGVYKKLKKHKNLAYKKF